MIFIFWVMMKTLQVGLGEILSKPSMTISKSTQNLWLVSKLQNLSVKGVQLRCLRVFNLCFDGSNLVLFWKWIGFARWEKWYELVVTLWFWWFFRSRPVKRTCIFNYTHMWSKCTHSQGPRVYLLGFGSIVSIILKL